MTRNPDDFSLNTMLSCKLKTVQSFYEVSIAPDAVVRFFSTVYTYLNKGNTFKTGQSFCYIFIYKCAVCQQAECDIVFVT